MGLGLVGAVGRIGGALVPHLLTFLEQEQSALLFGSLSLVAGVLIWLLPETKEVGLTNNLDDGEKLNSQYEGFEELDSRITIINVKLYFKKLEPSLYINLFLLLIICRLLVRAKCQARPIFLVN